MRVGVDEAGKNKPVRIVIAGLAGPITRAEISIAAAGCDAACFDNQNTIGKTLYRLRSAYRRIGAEMNKVSANSNGHRDRIRDQDFGSFEVTP